MGSFKVCGVSNLLAAYDSRRSVPALKGARVAKCITCRRWAVFPPRFRKCHGCQPTESARNRLGEAVAVLEAVNVPAPRVRRAKGSQASVGAHSLGRCMAMVAALAKDIPNLKASDLKPEYRECWPI